MKIYQNVNGNSGIAGYEIGDTYIEVEFADTEAAQGHGLNSFINRRVKYLYESERVLF